MTDDIGLDEILELGKRAKLKVYHDFLQQIKEGKSLSPGELRVFNALEAEFEQAEQAKKTPVNLILSTSQVAAFFDVTRHAVQKWLKAACPKIKHGQLDLKAVFDWWFENIAESKIPDTEKIQELKAQHLTERIRGERLKNAQTEGTLFDQDTVVTEWAARVAVVTSGLTAFADRLPPLLEGKGRIEMQEIIKKEVWELRDSYYRKGKYTPKVEISEYLKILTLEIKGKAAKSQRFIKSLVDYVNRKVKAYNKKK